jgi:hypothetical protein
MKDYAYQKFDIRNRVSTKQKLKEFIRAHGDE